MDAWMHGCMDAWMHGCMDAWRQRRLCSPIRLRLASGTSTVTPLGNGKNDIFVILGAKSGPSDQIGPPGHLATTCVHHNIGNEPTVAVT